MKKTLLMLLVLFTGIVASAQVKQSDATKTKSQAKQEALAKKYAEEKKQNPKLYKEMVDRKERPKLDAAGQITTEKH